MCKTEDHVDLYVDHGNEDDGSHEDSGDREVNGLDDLLGYDADYVFEYDDDSWGNIDDEERIDDSD